MRIKKYIWLAVGIMLIASLALAGCGAKGPSSSEPVKIGFVAPISGPLGDNGRQMLRGANLAVKKINDDGGILGGRQVELVALDDQADPAQAAAVTRKGITTDKVSIIAGTWDPGTGNAAWEVCQEFNMPFVQWSSGIKLIMNSYKGHLQQGPLPAAEVYPVAIYMEENNLKSIVILAEDFAYNRDLEFIFRSIWDKPGSPVEIKETIWVPLAKADLMAETTKAMSLNADAICFLTMTPPAIVAGINAASQLGYKGPNWGFGPLADPAFVSSFGPEANGTMIATWFAEYPGHKENMEIIKAFKEAGNEGSIGDQDVMSYDTIMFACLGMDKAGTDSDTEKIADAWKKLDYLCVCGHTPFQVKEYEGGGLRLHRAHRYMVTIQDGKMTNPEWFEFKWDTVKMSEVLNTQ
jgi:branched-chain amino acid transport system substrate-binding protein